MSRPALRLFPLVLMCFALGACITPPRLVNEYKIDVQQGNVLSQDVVAQLKPGQTRDQVRYLLGTPLIRDVFHQNRWDYVYSYQNGQTGQLQSRRFSVFFDARGLLERVAGDVDEASVAELTVPAARARLVDMGSLPEAGVAMPPVESPPWYRRFMDMIGF